MPRPGRGAGPGVGEQQYPMRGHEHVARDDVLAAGAREAADEPGVDDFAILDRQEKERTLVRWRCAGWGDHRAELAPLGDVAAAGEGPGAVQPIAAVDRDRRAGRGEAGN